MKIATRCVVGTYRAVNDKGATATMVHKGGQQTHLFYIGLVLIDDDNASRIRTPLVAR